MSEMGTSLPEGRLLELESPAGGGLAARVRPYASHYRFGGASQPGIAPVPLVLYVGGSISPAVYEARRSTPPTPLAQAFARALAQHPLAAVDLVLVPCPLDAGGDAESWVLDQYDQITMQLGARPAALGCLGYSAGAAYAATLAVVERARVAAFFGAAGLRRTMEGLRGLLEARAREAGAPLQVAYFMNDGDPLGREGTAWTRRFGELASFHCRSGPGGHPFAEYDANGLVRDAFAYVLERLEGVDGAEGR